MRLNDTHDPALRSWLESANAATTDFPIQNLPFGVFRRAGSAESFRGGVAIGDQVLDLGAVARLGISRPTITEAFLLCSQPSLNAFMALGSGVWSEVRAELSALLRTGSHMQDSLAGALVPQAAAELSLPAMIGDYTDFYTSIHHATAVGKLFRPDNPLLPNYKWVPIGYHGRASSIAISGHSFVRPRGQLMLPGESAPQLLPTRRLDFELEVGVFVGRGNPPGKPIDIRSAEQHVFGLCLLNDWSARDIQAWEYQPLGPFLAKNFASTISPWIVTMEALAPYRTAWTRDSVDPQPLPYLDSAELCRTGAIDIVLDVHLETERMRAEKTSPQRLSRSNFKHSYWSVSQLVAHHTVNGCNLQPGDLLGSGTQSGPLPSEAGSLLELTGGGKQPVELANGQRRTFIEDGDRLILTAACERSGFARIGFGEAAASVVAAVTE
jgi:fumarylacetoacetase